MNKKILTIKSDDKLNIIKGSPMTEFTYKVEGLVDGYRFILTSTMTTKVENTNTTGEYEITISGSKLTNNENYKIVYVNGKMTIVNKKNEATIENNTGNINLGSQNRPSSSGNTGLT